MNTVRTDEAGRTTSWGRRGATGLAAVSIGMLFVTTACGDDDSPSDTTEIQTITSDVTASSMVTVDSEVTVDTVVTSDVMTVDTVTDMSEVEVVNTETDMSEVQITS